MLNLESVFTYEGTHDIHTLIIGRDSRGWTRSPESPMGDEALLRAGEVVLLVDLRRGKRHLVTLRLGQAFHSDRGFIPYASCWGLPRARSA